MRLNPIPRTLALTLLLSGCAGMAPKPAMPDGSTKVPVNTEARMIEFQSRMAIEQQRTGEQRRLERELDDLRTQVKQLRTAAILLAQDAEGKRDSPLPKSPSSITPALRSALAGVPPAAQLVLAAEPVPPNNSDTTKVESAVAQKTKPLQAVSATIAAPAATTPTRTAVSAETVQTVQTLPPPRRLALAVSPSSAADEPRAEPIAVARPSTDAATATKPLTAMLGQPANAGAGQERSMIFRILLPLTEAAFAAPSPIIDTLIGAARTSRQIIVRGRTSADSEDAASLKLANDRAANARAFLIARGIAPERIWVNALATGGFVADNATTFGRALNSRVEIEVIDLDTAPFTEPKPWRPGPDIADKPLAAQGGDLLKKSGPP